MSRRNTAFLFQRTLQSSRVAQLVLLAIVGFSVKRWRAHQAFPFLASSSVFSA